MHVLLHYLSQLVVKMFPKSPAHDWWSFGLLASSSQQTPVKCILGRAPAQLPQLPVQGASRQQQVTVQAASLSKRKVKKISSSCWISKNCFPWRCLRARDVEEGRYLKRRGEFLGAEPYKSRMWELPWPCCCQAVEPAEVVDRKGSTGVVLTVFKHRVNTGDKDWLWLQFSFIHYIALDLQREPRVNEKTEQWVCLVTLDAELGSGSPARFVA